MVTKKDAERIIGLFEDAGVGIFIDGGWGIDALLGYESRKHNDIDHNLIFEGEKYPEDIFAGSGKIGNREVICISPSYQVQFHLGYDRDENDIKDVLLLCKTFNLEIP